MGRGQEGPRVRMVAVLALAAVLLVTAGCGSPGIPLQDDRHLVERAQHVLREGGAPVLFRDLSGGDWDRVHAFPGPPSLEIVESDIGAQLDVSGTYTPHHDGGSSSSPKRVWCSAPCASSPTPSTGTSAATART